ncbi:protein shisa-5-like [Menidia menidia]
MAISPTCVLVLVLCVTLSPCVSGGDRDCKPYKDSSNEYHFSQTCFYNFCCGNCRNRYCCSDPFKRFSEDEQEDCSTDFFEYHYSPVPMIVGIVSCIVVFLIFVCCCVCPCCCIYKMCRKPQPVIATTTHTTVVNTAPQQYPQQPSAMHGTPQAALYPPYQQMPVQPGYGAQAMPPAPYHGQPFTPGLPPTYQEATGPAFPPQPMPYSQAAFTPGQPAYPLQPPGKQQPYGAVPAQMDYLSQPAYNPDFVATPPTTG